MNDLPPMSLQTSYMGLQLNSPLIVGSCPLTIDPEVVAQLANAGAGAIVLPSMLQEQLVFESTKNLDYFEAIENGNHSPQLDEYNRGPKGYLARIQQIKSISSIPIIASLHGATIGKWLDYANAIQDNGADAIELNWQIGRCNPSESGTEVETRMLNWVSKIRSLVSLPIAFKMNYRLTNPAFIALQLQSVGVDGLVLFAHRPHWDVDSDRMHWTIGWELSSVGNLGRTLEGIVETRTKDLSISIAASGGIRTGDDVIKTMIAGANVGMIVSEIYRRGPEAITEILSGLRQFLSLNHYTSLQTFKLACPSLDVRPEYSMRSEIVDSLTSSNHHFDPAPTAKRIRGDAYGSSSY